MAYEAFGKLQIMLSYKMPAVKSLGSHGMIMYPIPKYFLGQIARAWMPHLINDNCAGLGLLSGCLKITCHSKSCMDNFI